MEDSSDGQFCDILKGEDLEMERSFVTLARFRSLMPAQYYKALLQSNGINAFLPEEQTVGLCSPDFWFIQLNAQLRLQVPREETTEALDCLREASAYAQTTEKSPITDDDVSEEEIPEGQPDLTGPRWLFACTAAWFLFYFIITAVTTIARAL
jgi:hypothetical protein